MIKFTVRQLNTLMDALYSCYIATMELKFSSTPKSQSDYNLMEMYLIGVCDALSLDYVNDNNYSERYYIYPSEIRAEGRDENGNRIHIVTIDALSRKVIYDIFKDSSEYAKKYSKLVREKIAEYYKNY